MQMSKLAAKSYTANKLASFFRQRLPNDLGREKAVILLNAVF
jgi:hypothetical protein